VRFSVVAIWTARGMHPSCNGGSDKRLNGENGGVMTMRQSSALAVAGLASIFDGEMVHLDVVRHWCSHCGSDMSTTMAQVQARL